jgi:predicted transcriptional regulator
MIKAFNLRLPEPLKLKLDFIRARTRVSVHEFIMEALVPAVDREIERLEEEQ